MKWLDKYNSGGGGGKNPPNKDLEKKKDNVALKSKVKHIDIDKLKFRINNGFSSIETRIPSSISQDNRSPEERKKNIAKARNFDERGTPYLTMPLNYLANPDQVLGDIGIPSFDNSQEFQDRINKIYSGISYETIPQVAKELLPNAVLNTGLALAGTPEGSGIKTFVNELVNPIAGINLKKILSNKNIAKKIEIPTSNNFKSEIDEVGNIFKNKPLPDIEKQTYKLLEEQQRFDALPLTKNKETLKVLKNFKTRINTPEGKQRLKELGITEDQILQKLKIVQDNTSYGYFRPQKNTIAIHPNLPMAGNVARHEIEHGVQNALIQSKIKKIIGGSVEDKLKSLNSFTTEIDDILSNISLKKEGTPNKVWSKSNYDKSVNINEFLSGISDKQKATDYFLTGSQGREKSAFLGEVQEYMMKTGVIPKNTYVNITPEMVKNTFVNAMFDEKTGGKYLRLFNIMKPDPKNYELISKALNKMLGVTPIGLGLGAASQMQEQDNVEQYQDGGIIKDNNGYWNPDNWGKVVKIDSNRITMKGVNQPLIGVSDKGDVQYMEPDGEYKFKGNSVIEVPIKAQNGHWLSKYSTIEDQPESSYEDYPEGYTPLTTGINPLKEVIIVGKVNPTLRERW